MPRLASIRGLHAGGLHRAENEIVEHGDAAAPAHLVECRRRKLLGNVYLSVLSPAIELYAPLFPPVWRRALGTTLEGNIGGVRVKTASYYFQYVRRQRFNSLVYLSDVEGQIPRAV